MVPFILPTLFPPVIPQPLPVRPPHVLECEPVPDLQTVVAFVNERLDALRRFLNGGVEVHLLANMQRH